LSTSIFYLIAAGRLPLASGFRRADNFGLPAFPLCGSLEPGQPLLERRSTDQEPLEHPATRCQTLSQVPRVCVIGHSRPGDVDVPADVIPFEPVLSAAGEMGKTMVPRQGGGGNFSRRLEDVISKYEHSLSSNSRPFRPSVAMERHQAIPNARLDEEMDVLGLEVESRPAYADAVWAGRRRRRNGRIADLGRIVGERTAG
jgi:hypothetical protein